MDLEEKNKIVFKKVNRKNLRLKKQEKEDQDQEIKNDIEANQSEIEDSNHSIWEKLQEIKLIYSLKKQLNCNLNAQNLWRIDSKDRSIIKEDSKKKGLVNELDLGNTFSVETNRRDEDADMLKFIEEQLAKRKGIVNETVKDEKNVPLDPDEMLFNVLPQHLLKTDVKKSEEMLSNQMLSGIPEVDLGFEEKIRNIEATEEAKINLLEKRKRKTHRNSHNTLVPSNIASNYIQYNHHNDESNRILDISKKPKISKPTTTLIEEPIVVIGDEPKQGYFRSNTNNQQNKLRFPGKEKASDDYHFEKFKKHFKK